MRECVCVCVCVSACVRGLACVGVRMYAYVSVCFFRLRTKKIAFFKLQLGTFSQVQFSSEQLVHNLNAA